MAAIELSDYIAELRSELAEAIAAGADHELRFIADNIELELDINAETKAEGSGKVSFKVFGIGAEGGGGGGRTSSTGQRLKLTLKLVDKTGKSPFIGADARSSRT